MRKTTGAGAGRLGGVSSANERRGAIMRGTARVTVLGRAAGHASASTQPPPSPLLESQAPPVAIEPEALGDIAARAADCAVAQMDDWSSPSKKKAKMAAVAASISTSVGIFASLFGDRQQRPCAGSVSAAGGGNSRGSSRGATPAAKAPTARMVSTGDTAGSSTDHAARGRPSSATHALSCGYRAENERTTANVACQMNPPSAMRATQGQGRQGARQFAAAMRTVPADNAPSQSSRAATGPTIFEICPRCSPRSTPCRRLPRRRRRRAVRRLRPARARAARRSPRHRRRRATAWWCASSTSASRMGALQETIVVSIDLSIASWRR